MKLPYRYILITLCLSIGMGAGMAYAPFLYWVNHYTLYQSFVIGLFFCIISFVALHFFLGKYGKDLDIKVKWVKQ